MSNETAVQVVLSRYAVAYTGERIGRLRRSPTWEDVSVAYDAGLTHGVDCLKRKQLQTYMRGIHVANNPPPIETEAQRAVRDAGERESQDRR